MASPDRQFQPEAHDALDLGPHVRVRRVESRMADGLKGRTTREPLEVAHTIAVGVHERLDVQVIGGGVLAPEIVEHPWALPSVSPHLRWQQRPALTTQHG